MSTFFSNPLITNLRSETANQYAADITYRNNFYKMSFELIGRDDSIENADKIFKENLHHIVHTYNSSIKEMNVQTKDGKYLKVEFISGEAKNWFNIDMDKPVSPLTFLMSTTLVSSAAIGIIALLESRYR